MALHIGQYGEVFRTLRWDDHRTPYLNVLRTLAVDFPWCYIEDDMRTTIGCLLATSSGRPRDIILPSGKIFI